MHPMTNERSAEKLQAGSVSRAEVYGVCFPARLHVLSVTLTLLVLWLATKATTYESFRGTLAAAGFGVWLLWTRMPVLAI